MRETVLITSILCFVGVFNLPYGYYTFLRILVFVVSLYLILNNKSYRFSKNIILALILAGILFNPIIPIHLSKSLWRLMDSITGFFFFILLSKIPENKKKH